MIREVVFLVDDKAACRPQMKWALLAHSSMGETQRRAVSGCRRGRSEILGLPRGVRNHTERHAFDNCCIADEPHHTRAPSVSGCVQGALDSLHVRGRVKDIELP